MPSIAIPVSLRGQLLSGARQTLTNILFSASEPGFTFEPWDITTLYQDRAGTTPVTAAGQSVGLRLSKDQGLRQGPELVSNPGSPFVSTTGWSDQQGNAPLTVSGGNLVATPTTAAASRTDTPISVVSGKSYKISANVVQYSGSGPTFAILSSRGGALVPGTSVYSTTGLLSIIFTAAATTTYYLTFGSNSSVIGVPNVISASSVRELAGNHQVAVSDAKRGVYGWMPKTGRRNLLTYTEQFDNAAWTKNSANAVADSTNNPNGVATGDTVRLNAGTSLITPALGLFTNPVPYVSEPTASSLTAATHAYSLYVKGGVGLTHVQLRVGLSATLNPAVSSTIVRLSDGVVIDGTGTVTDVGAGWFRVSLPFTATAAVHHCGIWFWNSASIASAAGTEGVYVWGAQLEVGSTATAYQRVVSQYDVTEAGVPTCYYVQSDGVDDAYVTPTITPGTDKAQVFAGVRKLSDATGIIIEPSTLSGSFYLVSGSDTGVIGLANGYTSNAHGSAAASAQQNSQIVVNGPDSAVITATHDIAGDLSTIRRNGIAGTSGTGDKGTGNFLAYPAYIYGRGGTSLPFNGLDFGHAVRFGPNLDAATIARVESLIARNTPEVTL